MENLLRSKPKLVVLTGAGISAESGLSTFRGTGGMWEGNKIEDVATPEAWRRNPIRVLEFYNQRRAQLPLVNANEAHILLKKLEAFYDVHIITQNVDDLHERSQSSNILHLHGELVKVRSELNDYIILDWGYKPLNWGDKGPDGAQLRPHVVWFGEAVPAMFKAESISSQADILVVIGTSLQVYPAANLIYTAPSHAEIWYIDPQPATITGLKKLHVLPQKATTGMKELYQILTSKCNPDER